MPRIYELFKKLDLDGSGDLTLDELHNAPAEFFEELSKFVNLEDLDQLHSILDQNNDGKLSWEEFFQGICKIVSRAKLLTLRAGEGGVLKTPVNVYKMFTLFAPPYFKKHKFVNVCSWYSLTRNRSKGPDSFFSLSLGIFWMNSVILNELALTPASS